LTLSIPQAPQLLLLAQFNFCTVAVFDKILSSVVFIAKGAGCSAGLENSSLIEHFKRRASTVGHTTIHELLLGFLLFSAAFLKTTNDDKQLNKDK